MVTENTWDKTLKNWLVANTDNYDFMTKTYFIATQLEIKIETSFARMHNYKLPISIPLARTKTRLWLFEREKQKKCYLPRTRKNMVASTLNMKSRLCFLNLN